MRLLLCLILIGTTACAPRTRSDPPGIAAEYQLVLIDGAPPPVHSPFPDRPKADAEDAMVDLRRGRVVLKPDGTYEEYWTFRRLGDRERDAGHFNRGRYSRDTAEMRLYFESQYSRTPATLTPTGFVWKFNGVAYTFDRVD